MSVGDLLLLKKEFPDLLTRLDHQEGPFAWNSLKRHIGVAGGPEVCWELTCCYICGSLHGLQSLGPHEEQCTKHWNALHTDPKWQRTAPPLHERRMIGRKARWGARNGPMKALKRGLKNAAPNLRALFDEFDR